jgi:hypothetical protein
MVDGGCHREWDGATRGKEPTVMSSLTMCGDLVHLGMDTSKDSIVVGILRSGEQVPDIDRVFWRRGVGAAVDRPV